MIPLEDKIAAVVREWMTEFSVKPYDYASKRGTIRHIYVRVGEKSGESQLTLISATKKMPGLDVLVERLPRPAEEPWKCNASVTLYLVW